MLAILEYAGAVGVLAAFALAQAGRWSTDGRRYEVVNTVAGVALATAGVASRQWGFVVLNGAWAAIGAHGLLTRRGRRRPPGPAESS